MSAQQVEGSMCRPVTCPFHTFLPKTSTAAVSHKLSLPLLCVCVRARVHVPITDHRNVYSWGSRCLNEMLTLELSYWQCSGQVCLIIRIVALCEKLCCVNIYLSIDLLQWKQAFVFISKNKKCKSKFTFWVWCREAECSENSFPHHVHRRSRAG